MEFGPDIRPIIHDQMKEESTSLPFIKSRPKSDKTDYRNGCKKPIPTVRPGRSLPPNSVFRSLSTESDPQMQSLPAHTTLQKQESTTSVISLPPASSDEEKSSGDGEVTKQLGDVDNSKPLKPKKPEIKPRLKTVPACTLPVVTAQPNPTMRPSNQAAPTLPCSPRRRRSSDDLQRSAAIDQSNLAGSPGETCPTCGGQNMPKASSPESQLGKVSRPALNVSQSMLFRTPIEEVDSPPVCNDFYDPLTATYLSPADSVDTSDEDPSGYVRTVRPVLVETDGQMSTFSMDSFEVVPSVKFIPSVDTNGSTLAPPVPPRASEAPYAVRLVERNHLAALNTNVSPDIALQPLPTPPIVTPEIIPQISYEHAYDEVGGTTPASSVHLMFSDLEISRLHAMLPSLSDASRQSLMSMDSIAEGNTLSLDQLMLLAHHVASNSSSSTAGGH